MSVLLSISKTYTGLQRKVTRVLLAYSLYRRTVIKEIRYSRFHIQAHPIAYVILGTDSTHDRKLYRFHSLTLSTNLAIHTFFNGTPRRNVHRKVLCIHKYNAASGLSFPSCPHTLRQKQDRYTSARFPQRNPSPSFSAPKHRN